MWRTWSEMKSSSRIWAFALSRPAESHTEIEILTRLGVFCDSWTSHQSPVIGSAYIYKQRFLLLAADAANISGCSIDQMRKGVNEILTPMHLELLDSRMVVWINHQGEWRCNDWLDLNEEGRAEIRAQADFVFSPFPSTIDEFSKKWPHRAKESLLLR